MNATRTAALITIMLLVSNHALGKEAAPAAILKKVADTYKALQTYKAEGTITSDMDTGSMKMKTVTSFSILLKKPNLYLISWNQQNMPMPRMAQSGTVWSDGTQPYLLMGIMNAYSKMENDEMALASATGISGGAAFTIPSLFFSKFKEQTAPFSRLKNPTIEKAEKIGDEDCYVISGASTVSKQETFWVSKTTHLIKKYSRSLEPPEGGMQIPEMTEEQIEEAIKGMGQEVTEESKKNIKEMMKNSQKMLKTVELKGSTTELHKETSSPKLDKEDFKFTLPKGTVLKDSIGEMIGGNQGASFKIP